jgi:tetratricopeptide (TPR) repeat protein
MRIHLTIAACLGLIVATSSWARTTAAKNPGSAVSAPTAQAELAQLNSEGAAAMRRGDFAGAIQSYGRLTKLAPAVAEFHANLGFAYYSASRFREAIPPSRQALKLKPSLTGPRYFLALSLAQTGECSEALALIEKDLPRVPDRQLKRLLGSSGVRCAMAGGQPDKAVDLLRLLTRDFPDDSQFLYLSTLVYSELSTRASQRLLQTAPGSLEAHQLNAEVLELQGKVEDAREEYRKILAMNPRQPGIHQRIGHLLLAGELTPEVREEARREFEQELQLDPANALAEYELGEMARQARQWNEAITHFQRAVELDPASTEALVGLGKSLVSAGYAPDAVAPLERAVELAPASAVARYQLSFAYRRVGHDDDAKRELALYQGMHEEDQKLRQTIRAGIQGAISQPQTAEPPE